MSVNIIRSRSPQFEEEHSAKRRCQQEEFCPSSAPRQTSLKRGRVYSEESSDAGICKGVFDRMISEMDSVYKINDFMASQGLSQEMCNYIEQLPISSQQMIHSLEETCERHPDSALAKLCVPEINRLLARAPGRSFSELLGHVVFRATGVRIETLRVREVLECFTRLEDYFQRVSR